MDTTLALNQNKTKEEKNEETKVKSGSFFYLCTLDGPPAGKRQNHGHAKRTNGSGIPVTD
jgi:hypothetical protein